MENASFGNVENKALIMIGGLNSYPKKLVYIFDVQEGLKGPKEFPPH